jgi:hypothetical protein
MRKMLLAVAVLPLAFSCSKKKEKPTLRISEVYIMQNDTKIEPIAFKFVGVKTDADFTLHYTVEASLGIKEVAIDVHQEGTHNHTDTPSAVACHPHKGSIEGRYCFKIFQGVLSANANNEFSAENNKKTGDFHLAILLTDEQGNLLDEDFDLEIVAHH